jgi:hypothetical protein
MTPIEKLSSINFLSVCDVAMDIKEELQMTKENMVQIPVLRTMIRPAPFNQLFPIDSISTRDNYGEYRIKALEYLKTNNFIVDFEILDSYGHRWEDGIRVSIEKNAFDKFYDDLSKVYQKRVVDPNIKQEAEKNKIAELDDEEIKKIKIILDVINIKLSISHKPYIVYIPFQDFPTSIQRFEIMGLLYKLSHDLNAIKFTQVVGQVLEKQEVEIRISDDKLKFYELKNIIDEKYKNIVKNNKSEPNKDGLSQQPILKKSDEDELKIKLKTGTLILNKNTGYIKLNKVENTLNPASDEFKVILKLSTNKNYKAVYSELTNGDVSKTSKRNLTFIIRNIKENLGILPKKKNKNKDIIKNLKNHGYQLIS